MARKQSRAQKETVERVMHEFKHGELKTAKGKRTVRNPRQAIAIALHEAGASKDENPGKNAENLRKTKAKERKGETGKPAAKGSGGPTRAELYEQAKRRNIPGRSKMSKGELERALHR